MSLTWFIWRMSLVRPAVVMVEQFMVQPQAVQDTAIRESPE